MLQRSRWSALAVLCCWLMAGAVQAANINFNGSNTVPVCPLSGATYTCATLPLGSNDTAVISSGYTVVVNSGVSLAYAQGLSMSGTAALQVKGNLDLSASNGLNVTGGSLSTTGNFKLGASAQSITANVSAATVTTAGASTYIGGTVTSSGDINLGSSTTITGAVSTTGTGSLTTGSSSTLGPLSVKGSINLSSSNTINGSVTATSITTNSSVTINGSITLAQTSGGVADLGSGIKVNGTISAYSVQTTSPVTLNGDVSAVSSLTLASGSSVTGNIVSPVVTLNASNSTVKGNITASTSLDMGSGVAVTGTVNTGGLTMRASNSVINGNATVTGDVDMGSGTTINGDLSARNVNTRASNAVINGNAAVNAIYIDWGNSVTKTITCTGAGASGCSCVTKADPNYKPTCGAAQPSAPHHFQITHSGSGLTCQPSKVTVRACADATCSTLYTGNAQTTLAPNGGTITVSGDTAASVSYPQPGPATLSAGPGTICVNTGANNNSCDMQFASTGLTLTAPDHVSMTPGVMLSIQAQKAGPNNSSCVPLAQGKATFTFNCRYTDPSSGPSLTLGSSSLSCNGGTTTFDVNLDSTGLGNVALQYPDVGQLSVNANYTAPGGTGANGGASFTVAPKAFRIDAKAVTDLTGLNTKATPPIFAHASDPFTLTVTAVNYNGGTTSNFGKESSPQSFKISKVLKLPSDGVDATTQGTFTAISNGVTTSTNDQYGPWVFAEAGTLTINVAVDNNNHSGFYMDKSRNDFKTVGTADLRFVPHHFSTEVLLTAPTIPMSCANVGGYSNPCAPSNTSGNFVYSRQQFPLQVKVYKDSTTLSQNYRLRTPGSGDSDDVARTPTLALAQPTGGSSIANISFKSIPSLAFSQGIAQLTGSNMPSLQFNNNDLGPTTVLLRASDTDNVSSQLAGAVEAPLTAVSGKMLISNAYGPANTPLPVEARAMYWSSAAGAWLFNPLFTPQSPAMGAAVSLQTGDGTFTTCAGGLNCNSLSLKATTLQFKNGKTIFQIAPPNASGRVTVGLKQSPFMDNNFPYLLIDAGTVTFGTSRPSPVIYTREVYN
jgi:MSHA biogenesis protein MshQ